LSKTPNEQNQLRTNAEAQLARAPEKKLGPRPAEKLLHELQLHQIELEMQNEQLRQSQVELEKSRDRYLDFYDFSPVGYLTLNHGGMIDEINLTGAAMLGVERNKLPYRRFANFVATEDRDRWHLYFLNVLKSDDTLACELTLQHDDAPSFYARLDCLCLKNGDKESVVRVVLTDAQLEKTHRQTLRDIEYQKFAMDQHSIVAITDVSGTITYANDKFCSISQYSRDELLGQNHRLLNSGTHSKEFFNDMYRTIAAGEVWHGDICNRAKDGSLYWVATTIVPNLDSDGLPFQYVAIRTDITERKKSEEARTAELEQVAENMRIFVKHAPISIAMFDCTMNYLAASDQWIADYGRGYADLVGRNHYEVHPDLPDGWRHVHQQCLAGATLKNDNDLWYQSDGSREWLSWVVLPWRYPSGKIGGIIISAENITERKIAEEALRKSEENYRSLFANMLDGYAHCRILLAQGIPQDFIYLNVNSQFEKLTGLKNVVGKKVSEVIPGIRESNPELLEIYGRVASTGNPESFETYLEPLRIWFSVAVYSTEKEHFVAVFKDITEHKQSEQELIVMNNQLTHEVAKRTADLSALTAHIQKIAESERSNLARELHDELGSTLAGISMELGRLKGKISAPELLQDMSLIKELVSHATQTTRGVIDQLYPTVLDTYGFVAAVEWLVNEYRKHSEIDVELALSNEEFVMEPTFALAAYRITQECLTNVAKHAGASKVHIDAKASNGFLDLTIHDNGKGLSGRINTGSHGIFGMIERARYLGGLMEIGSEDGKGTTAHLHLPLASDRPTYKKRVLVVDDHAIVRDALRQLLDRETDDFSVEGEAADGKVAVQMAIEGEWDLMLLDITLPKKNGIKVLEEVIAVKSNLPIIMLSSHSKDEYGELALSKGAAGYIEKGETSKLIEAMRRATLIQQ
jgi:PAS domain S-box-containing protein